MGGSVFGQRLQTGFSSRGSVRHLKRRLFEPRFLKARFSDDCQVTDALQTKQVPNATVSFGRVVLSQPSLCTTAPLRNLSLEHQEDEWLLWGRKRSVKQGQPLGTDHGFLWRKSRSGVIKQVFRAAYRRCGLDSPQRPQRGTAPSGPE